MNNRKKVLSGILSMAVLSACSSTPASNSQVESLREQYVALASLPNASEYAASELSAADNAVKQLAAAADDADSKEFEHLAFMAESRLGIAGEVIEMKTADATVANAGQERQETLLVARTAEAESAKMKAELMEERAEVAEAAALQMASRAEELEQSVTELTTEQTERGMVLTLGDILFEVGKSELKPGAERSIGKVADFLSQYPDRSIRIEGFTDSTGSDSFNEQLSDDRAQAVKELLVARGVESDQITTQGYGEQYPVASNDSDAGRLQNRRVEIVLSNSDNQAVAGRR